MITPYYDSSLTSTATGASGASTCHAPAGLVTTEALTTAALTDYTHVITNNQIVPSSKVFVSLGLGTSSAGDPVVGSVTPSGGSVSIVVRNAHATVALNGTLKLSFLVV